MKTLDTSNINDPDKSALSGAASSKPNFGGRYTAVTIDEGTKLDDFIEGNKRRDKRDFFIHLFMMYKDLPFETCLANFAHVYNDVFIRENYTNMSTYCLSELQIVEHLNISLPNETFEVPFKFNFTNATSKNVDFSRSIIFREYLRVFCREIKRTDNLFGDEIDLQKRGVRNDPNLDEGQKPAESVFNKPTHGEEFFFANVLVKVYQVPMLFCQSSEFAETESDASFIVLIFEKTIRKRAFAKNKKDKERLKRKQNLKRKGIKCNDDRVQLRESKMRRFCNYFMTIFNVKKLNPFVQFVKASEYHTLKLRILNQMEYAFNMVEGGLTYGKMEIEAGQKGIRSSAGISSEDKVQLEKLVQHPNEKVANCTIQEKQALKMPTFSVKSAASFKKPGSLMSHPEQDKDITPLGSV